MKWVKHFKIYVVPTQNTSIVCYGICNTYIQNQNYQYDVKIHIGSFLYANFHNFHKIQTNIPNIYTTTVLTNTITCSILIFKMTQNKKTYLSCKRCWRTFDRQVFPHKTRKNALKSLLHIHEVISSNIRAFLQCFQLCKSFHTNNLYGKSLAI